MNTTQNTARIEELQAEIKRMQEELKTLKFSGSAFSGTQYQKLEERLVNAGAARTVVKKTFSEFIRRVTAIPDLSAQKLTPEVGEAVTELVEQVSRTVLTSKVFLSGRYGLR